MKQLLLVFVGGGLGSMARFGIGKLVMARQLNVLWGTFAANVLGSFLIGIILGYALKSSALNQNMVLLIATGFCGGFTTFSTFAYENQELLRDGQIGIFLLYTIASFSFALGAVFFGLYLTKSI